MSEPEAVGKIVAKKKGTKGKSLTKKVPKEKVIFEKLPESPDDKLTMRQEKFCKLFASDKEFFGNGSTSYMEAYPDASYASARTNASRLLTNANILQRINDLLENAVLNDEFVDKQLAFIITQNVELNTKLGAIKEYNALKSRVTKKLKLEGELGVALVEFVGEDDEEESDEKVQDTDS